MYQNIYLFIPFKIRKKDWAKWARLARILKNTLTDEQLCSLTCFLVFACSDKYQNIIYLYQNYLIRQKDRAKWARILKNTLLDEQLCSLICFLVFAYLNIYQNIYSFFRIKIRKKIELNELNELEYSKAPSTMSSYTQEHVFMYLHAQTNINILLYWSYKKLQKFEKNSIWILRKKRLKNS